MQVKDKMHARDKEKIKAGITQLAQSVKEGGQRVTQLKAVSEYASSPVRESKMRMLANMSIQACALFCQTH